MGYKLPLKLDYFDGPCKVFGIDSDIESYNWEMTDSFLTTSVSWPNSGTTYKYL